MASHAQGLSFLRCLLRVLGEDDTLSEGERVRVRREVTTARGDSRLDITAESTTFFLCIEAKTDGNADPEQLRRYRDQVIPMVEQQRKRFIGRLLVPAAPSFNLENTGFQLLLWRNVARAFKLFGEKGDNVDFHSKSPFIRQLALQYALFIEATMPSLEKHRLEGAND